MKSKIKSIISVLGVFCGATLAACYDDSNDEALSQAPDYYQDLAEDNNDADNPAQTSEEPIDPGNLVDMAQATLMPASGSNVYGVVTYTREGSGIAISANFSGLSPGRHGFHIHETGDCSAADASSAGGHFAPDDNPHGGLADPADERHAGDFGNLNADSSGEVHYQHFDNNLSFTGDETIIGRAVIVHQQADDLDSQPSGESGQRVACGVIEPVSDAV